MEISKLQEEVGIWANRNFNNENRVSVALGLSEEVGELSRAVLKQHQGLRGTSEEWDQEIQKEVGDVVIKLAQLAYFCNFDLESIIKSRWDDIQKRDWIADPKGHGIPKEI